MSVELDETQPAARDSGPLMPTKISRFEVKKKLGEGGNGIVYLALDPTLDRNVAIKILRRGGSSEASQRLLREAQSAAKLSHESVIVVHEVGTVDDQVYVAMEHVAGGTLTDWQRGKPWRDVLDLYLRAGRGLAAAHAAGMVHRDFKPDNVLVGDDGRVRITDFGLVTTSSGKPPADARDLELTKTGTVMGTPRYMAPEQHLGEAVDSRTDQFAFCVALYEALWSRAPFAGDTYGALADAVLAGEIAPPPASDVPSAARAAVLRGLSRERGDRFASMTELLAALTPRTRTRRWIAPAAVLVVAGLATALVVHNRRDPETASQAFEAAEDAYSRHDYPAAVAAFKRAFALDPRMSDSPAYLYNIAQSYRQMGNCAEAQFSYKRYLELDPNAANRAQVEGLIKDLDACVAAQGSATR